LELGAGPSTGRTLGDADEDCPGAGAEATFSIERDEGDETQPAGYQTHLAPVRVSAGLTPRDVKKITDDLNKQAREAHQAGNKARYEEIQRQIVGVREYGSMTFGKNGKARTFKTEFDTADDLLRHNIRNAIAAIQKQAPKLAAHLKKHIRGESGRWRYTGGVEWQLQAGDEPATSSDPTEKLALAWADGPDKKLPQWGARWIREKWRDDGNRRVAAWWKLNKMHTIARNLVSPVSAQCTWPKCTRPAARAGLCHIHLPPGTYETVAVFPKKAKARKPRTSDIMDGTPLSDGEIWREP